MKLELYIRKSCPYCQKVLEHLSKLGKQVPLKEIDKDESSRKRLIEVGGKQQVPCLFIDNKPLYESEDIKEWLSNNVKEIP
ncbi:MAG: glutaredoxin [Chlamydiota bacterium]|jgi:glutaredoxin